jgi:hypothetical protein
MLIEREFVCELGEHIAMARFGVAVTSEALAHKFGERGEQLRLGLDPLAVLRDDIRAVAVGTDYERIAPLAASAPADVNVVIGVVDMDNARLRNFRRDCDLLAHSDIRPLDCDA